MFSRRASHPGTRLAALVASVSTFASALALAHEPPVATGWPWDPDVTNVPSAPRHPRPAGRVGNQRNVIAQEDLGGWRTYLGDLHVHSRGHGEPTPNINRDEVNLSAWYFGYDFYAITNHATSWKLYDERAPLYRTLSSANAPQAPELIALKGVESYAGPGNQAHFNAFHKLLVLDTDSQAVWHAAIVANYSADPLRSTHVQLNHPNWPDPWFVLPSATDPLRRRAVREAVELAEYNDRDAFFELLRRGFRVAPTSNSDTHAAFQLELAVCGGSPPASERALSRYLPEPGVPPEKYRGEALGRRTGIVLPVDSPFSYEGLLQALRDRRVFRTTVPAASGFFVANGYTMGSEFTLEPGEQRLDFTIWGTTKGGGRDNAWRRLEVWSPSRPEAPVHVVEYGDPALVHLKQTVSLTPYESIYVVRLEQHSPEAEVVLAPIWITNPTARPRVSFPRESVWRGDTVCLRVEGGGDALQVQRADTVDASGAPAGWLTVESVRPEPAPEPDKEERCVRLATGGLTGQTHWRVVDGLQPDVTSNTATLRLREYW